MKLDLSHIKLNSEVKKTVAKKKVSKRGKNKNIESYEKIQAEKKKINNREEKTVRAIRGSFVETVVMFIDMVGSSQDKTSKSRNPEKWLRKVHQFSKIVTTQIKRHNGKPVKYIGDEVMVEFTGKNKINDAI